MNTSEAANKWNCNASDVASWCKDGKIPGSEKDRWRHWIVPDDAKRPIDRKLQKELLWRIVELQNGTASSIDLTMWGIADSDVSGYLGALYPLLIRRMGANESSPLNEVQITEAGFHLIGRNGVGNQTSTPSVLIWAADFAGAFSAAFLRVFLNGIVEDMGELSSGQKDGISGGEA